jgi:hypothetical protein
MRFVLTLGLIFCALGLLAGCKSGTPAGTAPAVNVLAYVNVSSGCQQATVDFLKQLQAENGSRMKLEFVDFGDGGAGAQRWQNSGHSCQTIEINGASSVRFPVGGQPKTVTFQMPVGFQWTFDDLKGAVQAALKGDLQPASETEAAAANPGQVLQASVQVTSGTEGQAKVARVLINQAPVLVIKAGVEGKTPLQRAEAMAAALRTWLAKPVKPSQLSIQPGNAGVSLMGGPNVLIVVTDADAQAAGKTLEEVAQEWGAGLKHALVASAGSQGGPAQ